MRPKVQTIKMEYRQSKKNKIRQLLYVIKYNHLQAIYDYY